MQANTSSDPDVVVCLCDVTGVMATPWVEAGYSAILVDPKHPRGVRTDGRWMRIGAKIDDPVVWTVLRELAMSGRAAFAAGFPPCTDLASSGAGHWAAKAKNDPDFQTRAMQVVWQCHAIGEMLGCPWMIENPAGAVSRLWREADHSFDPADYTGWCRADNYLKKTMIWSGGGFDMPPEYRAPESGVPDSRIVAISGNDRAAVRSVTPAGFARAVFFQHQDF